MKNRYYHEFDTFYKRYVRYAEHTARTYGFSHGDEGRLGVEVIQERSDVVVLYRLHYEAQTLDVTVRFPDPESGISQYARDHEAFAVQLQKAAAALIVKHAAERDTLPSMESVRLLATHYKNATHPNILRDTYYDLLSNYFT